MPGVLHALVAMPPPNVIVNTLSDEDEATLTETVPPDPDTVRSLRTFINVGSNSTS